MAPTLKICSFVSQTSKMDFWFACFQLFLKDNGTFMVYIMFSRGLAKWLDRMNPKDILGKLKATAGIWGGLDISIPGKGQLHRVRKKTGSQGVLTSFAFTLTPAQFFGIQATYFHGC